MYGHLQKPKDDLTEEERGNLPEATGKGGWELGYGARQGRLTEDWGLGSCSRGRRPSRVAHSCGKPELGLVTYLLIAIHA